MDFEPRGQKGLYERLPDLNLECAYDFHRAFRQWGNFKDLIQACETRAKDVLQENGLDPALGGKMSYEDLLPLMASDPMITLYGRAWQDGQWYKFMMLNEAFHARADKYFDEMEAADNEGPGTLELHPTMHIPDYAAHEIHTQLGGYVGNAFAGHIYYYGTQILYDGRDEQDQTFDLIAQGVSLPADGKVKRILDQGTGAGQLATSLKRRFPEAEVWGIDAGGPMVRFAHMRANDIGVNVNFRQAMAEASGFPDGYFDLITSTAMHHEASAEGSKQIFAESHRILRPGGVFAPGDSGIRPVDTPFQRLKQYINWRWNHEDWWLDWLEMDKHKSLVDAGFKLGPDDIPHTGRPNAPRGYVGRKV